ncbi:MAG: ribosome biogenesis factor YjgA [Woeseiaceae bacterium]|nr:ribosome biogenesis factor YjgA [Woeseiaceae bacterium]
MVGSKPSKTAQKREQQALKQLGEELIGLPGEELERLELDERLLDAVLAAKRIKSHGALRRQRQLVAKLMRNVDPEPIRGRLAEIRRAELVSKRLFSNAERWRDRIADEGLPAVEAFRAETGSTDDGLELLVAELERAVPDKARRAIRRKIFRCVNDVLVAGTTDDRISR